MDIVSTIIFSALFFVYIGGFTYFFFRVVVPMFKYGIYDTFISFLAVIVWPITAIIIQITSPRRK
ncbi:MAG: hypothetical protein ACOC1O_00080 [bacterium]